MILCELCRTFSSSTVSVFCDGKRLWFGNSYDLPYEYHFEYVRYADAIPRKKFRTNQTDLYVFIQKN